MLLDQYGQWVRGNPTTTGSITGNPGATIGNYTVDMRPFDHLLEGMDAPVVKEFKFRVSGTMVADATGEVVEDFWKLFSLVRMYDAAGTFFELGGPVHRVLMQGEFGQNVVEDFNGTAVGSGATDTAHLWHFTVPFFFRKGMRRKDYGVELLRFVRGGGISFTLTQTPNMDTATSLTITPYMRIVDERAKELKPRVVTLQQNISAAEATYDVNGFCRWAFVTSQLATAGYTSLSTYSTLNSNTLLLPGNFETSILKENYLRQSAATLASGDEFLASNAIPLLTPDEQQNFTNLPKIGGFHLRLASAPSGGKFVSQAIVKRDPGLSASILGYGSVAAMDADLAENGVIVGSNGKRKAITDWKDDFWNYLPIRRAPGRAQAQ